MSLLPSSQIAARQSLLRRLADGTLSADEFRQLEESLRQDPAARADYVRFMDLEAGLYEEMLLRADDPAHTAAAVPWLGRPLGKGWLVGLATLAAAVVLSIVALNGLSRRPAPTRFIEARLKGLDDAAVVTHVAGIEQASQDRPLVMGTRLKPGILELRQGELQVDFLSGARVLLKAPAELHLLSSTAATLVSGSIAARVGDGAEKFVLGTPDAAIVDLGTEFAVNVDDAGDSQVRVYDGEVEVSLLGDDGSTVFNQRLKEKETVAIDRASRSVRPVELPDSVFVSVREVDRSSLEVTPAYVALVRQAKPSLYWRFEEAANQRIRNDGEPGHDGRIVVDPREPDAIRIEGGSIRFSAAERPRYLIADAPLEQINAGAFTVELWLKSETFHWGTIVNLMVPGLKSGPDQHMALIELAHHTQMVHKPSVIRFLHRHPPGAHTWGWNLFGKDTCMPGQWTHVVAVKEPDQLRLYVNGVLVRSVQGDETAGNDANAYLFSVGQMGTHPTARKFQGMIDELALYRRALTPKEISEHYWTMLAGNGRRESSGPVADAGRVPEGTLLSIPAWGASSLVRPSRAVAGPGR